MPATAAARVVGLACTARITAKRGVPAAVAVAPRAATAARAAGAPARPRRAADAARAGHVTAATPAQTSPVSGTALPPPEVHIDNLSDPLATIVTVKFGDFLGELLDTTQALKNLGLDIVRAELAGDNNRNRFYVTDAKTSDKIVLSERIEDIRTTIIKNMLEYHPESATAGLAMFVTAKKTTERADANPLGPRAPSAIPTRITVTEKNNGARSELILETTDRPGLLVDIVRVLKDCSLNVVSANVDTVGAMARDTFYVTHRGRALSSNMVELVTNALTYYLTMAEVEANESY